MSWYHIPGNEQDAVISTRIRFARNLATYPFPSRLDAPRAKEIVNLVGNVLEKNGFSRVDFSDISRTTAQSLAEKHYASPAFIRESLPHALFLNEPCNLSVMVCEEDHIRLQCILSGLSLQDAYAGACKVESLLDGAMELAFDQKLGYLTACPTNLGTAMRASVLLCLPMLTTGGRMEAFSLQFGQMGLLIRGLYGENTPTAGCLYQISNRLTLGMTEEDILNRLQYGISQIIQAERKLRTTVSGVELNKLTDRIQRAEGILRYAYTLTEAEMLELICQLRLGASMGMTDVRVEALTSLLVDAMPATLTLSSEAPLKQDHERDILRAKMVKQVLFGA